MSRLEDAFARKKAQGRAAFVPYITAGDPDLPATKLFVETLVAAGADVVELGVPFSDPMADGPVNQRSAERALKTRITLRKVLEFVRELRASGVTVPIVLFTYFNPVFAFGCEAFAREAARAGVDGVLALDLPPEEGVEYRRLLRAAGIDTVFLAAPTTSDARLKLIDEAASGFVYYVSRTGVTGVQSSLSGDLEPELRRLRTQLTKPVAVGFGISDPTQARTVAKLSDGVVVGSALVRLIEEHPKPADAAARIRDFATALVAGMNT